MKDLLKKVLIFVLSIICFSCGNNYLKDLSIIKEKKIINDYDTNGYTPLMAAVRYGDYELTKYLIDNKADVNKTKIGADIFSLIPQ